MKNSEKKPKLLLHICCVGCGASISRELGGEYDVSLFFFNPNIFPEEEHDKRLAEAKKIAAKFGLPLMIGDYNHEDWLAAVAGLEHEPEKGKRCLVCFRCRLDKTALIAVKEGFDAFATTLSVSPHKNVILINEIGRELAVRHGVDFLDRDFKKKDGYKKSVILSRELELYRQNYCGCEFSKM